MECSVAMNFLGVKTSFETALLLALIQVSMIARPFYSSSKLPIKYVGVGNNIAVYIARHIFRPTKNSLESDNRGRWWQM